MCMSLVVRPALLPSVPKSQFSLFYVGYPHQPNQTPSPRFGSHSTAQQIGAVSACCFALPLFLSAGDDVAEMVSVDG